MRIKSKFNELNEKKKSALITYITAGDPNLKDTKDIVLKLESSGADIIELGIPFSDPMADGPAIQLASERAIKSGATLTKILKLVKEIRKQTQIPIILFGYYNPFFIYGLDRFAKDAKKAGVDGVLVVDLPPEESYEFKRSLNKENLDLVFLLAPTSTSDRIKLVSKNCSGFIYLVSVTGWGPDGRELFYRSASRQLTAVPIEADGSFNYGNPEVVFEETYFFRGNRLLARTYDISPDGKRFLMIKEGVPGVETDPTQVILVLNWLDELKRLVPVDN